MNGSVVKTLLRPYPDQAMAFWAVDRRVGNVRNDDPDLFAPRCAKIRPAGNKTNPANAFGQSMTSVITPSW